MNKTLTALLLALTSAWAVDQNPVVEMYPDDMPKSQLVFQGEMPASFYYQHHKEYFRSDRETFDTFIKQLSKSGLEEIRLNHKYFFDEIEKDPVFFFGNLKTSEFALCLFQNREELEPKLGSFKGKIHDSVFSPNKWNPHWEYPDSKLYWTGKYETLNDMSLKYVDCFIHCQMGTQGCTVWEEVLYEKVRSKELEQSIFRLMIVFNNKGEWSISVPCKDDSAKKFVLQKFNGILK